MFDRKTGWQGKAGTALVLFLLLMVRACAFGFRYYPQLDDYIQYHNYLSSSSFWALQQSTGLLASRPLAGIMDFFLWGPMFQHMILGVALISLLYVLTTLLFWDILERWFAVGPLFPMLMALLPLGMEGTYWMSASTRVVVGMLFAALAAWAFLNWLDRGGLGRLALYMVLQLLPFGFYEQAGILSVTLTVGAAVLEWLLGRNDLRPCLVSLWGVPSLGLYFLFTHLMAAGNAYSSRAEILLPISRYYWRVFFPDIMGQIRDVFFKGGFFTLVKGFVRGTRMIASGQLLLWALAVLALSVLMGRLALQQTEGKRRMDAASPWLALLAGLLLAVGPVSLFLVLGNPWFSLRGAVTSFPGLALIGDTAVMTLWGLVASRKSGPAVLAGAMAFVFCVAGASEIKDYKDTCENDQRIASLVLDTLSQDGLGAEAGRIGILGLEASLLPNQNFFFHEHIHGCTESSWAFAGLLTAVGGGGQPSVTPLPTDPMYRLWNRESNHPESFDVLYWFDGETLTRAELTAAGEERWEARNAGGRTLCHIWEEDSVGYIRTPEQLAGG